MKLKIYLLFTLIVALCSPPGAVLGDRGIVSPSDVVYVREPTQKAIILWNGEREALYLTTDIHARFEEMGGEKIDLIEVMPLPSRPEVKAADEKTFSNLNRLLQEKKARMSIYGYESPYKSEMGGGYFEREEGYPGVYIEFYSMVGLHNVSVVRVENVNSFMRWMGDYYRSIKGENFTLPSWIRGRVEDYLSRGINYFVFDYISVYPNRMSSVKPMVFFFNTTYLYYPMYISSGIEGHGEVRLFIITDQLLPENEIQTLDFNIDDRIPLRRSELKSINSTMDDFPFRNYLQLYVLTTYITYSDVNYDLHVETDGVYTPPMYSLLDLLLIVIFLAVLLGVLYILWRRNLSRE